MRHHIPSTPLFLGSQIYQGCFTGSCINMTGEMRGKGGGEAPCLSQTRKPELGGIRTLAHRPGISSAVAEPDLHVAESLRHEPAPCLSACQAPVWHKMHRSPVTHECIRTWGVSGRVPPSFPNSFAKICNLAKLKNLLH